MNPSIMKIRDHAVRAILALVTFVAMGCVSQKHVDELDMQYRRSQEQILDLRAELEEKQTEIEVLRSALESQDPDLRSKLDQALSSHDKLTKALARAQTRLRSLGTGPVLDPELDAALIQLAQAHQRLMSYDSQVGMVKFQSDLTFPLGSADVSPDASSSLEELAQILTSSAGSDYALRIVGHTDNVPIGRPATRAQHRTNWHLSVHRAIAVKDVLERSGVKPSRMSVEGYGEHKPIAPNGPKGNQANRRVEIYLVRQTAVTGLHDKPAGGSAQLQPGLAKSNTPPSAPPPEGIESPSPDQGGQASGIYK